MALRADDVDLCRDRDLVVRSQAGDDGAFEDLYRRYFGRLYRSCVRRLHDPHAAEEVAQEAFARAYRALPRLGGERKFYPWLSVIAARLCTDEFRRRARSEPAAVIDLGAWEGDHDRVLRAVDTELLGQAMARLTPRHRDVLSLREHHGWSYQHIAEHLGVNLGTVEALLHRARKALKREFDMLAGPDHAMPAAAGVGLGWMGRKLAALRLKLRVDDWAVPSWAPAVGNAMAAAAVVVGSTTMLTGAGNTHAAAVTMTPAAAVAAPASAAAPAPATAVRAPTAATSAAAPKAPAPKAERPPGAAVPSVLQTESVGGQQANDRSKDHEVNRDTEGVFFGVNPTGAANEAALTANDYIDDLRRESE